MPNWRYWQSGSDHVQDFKVSLYRIWNGKPRWIVASPSSDGLGWSTSGPYYDTRWQARQAVKRLRIEANQ